MSVEVGRDNEIAQAVYRRNGFAPVDHRLMTAVLAEAAPRRPVTGPAGAV
jgi:hypothetical protein